MAWNMQVIERFQKYKIKTSASSSGLQWGTASQLLDQWHIVIYVAEEKMRGSEKAYCAVDRVSSLN